jgi:4-hydroxy-tetrahydrodipicolinate reductase
MGGEILRAAETDPSIVVVAAVEAPGHPRLGQSLATSGGDLRVTDDLAEALGRADVLVDFTAPSALSRNVAAARAAKTPLVIGTTGLLDPHLELIRAAATDVPVVVAPNMSIGVNVMFGLLDMAVRALGDAYDIELLEAHHRHKVDAPSGTALRMAEVLCAASGRDPRGDLRQGREGAVGPRTNREIGMQVIRGGDVAGEHTVFFLGEGERVELAHRASSRAVFAKGALRAARWVVVSEPGVYGMKDVLGL